MIALTLEPIYLILIAIGIILFFHLSFLITFILIIDKTRFNKRMHGKKYYDDPKLEHFPNLKSEDFSFYSENNKLIGNILYHKDKNDKIIIFANGINSNTFNYLSEINFLCSLGYTIYSYDNTGTCRSEGKSLRGMSQAVIDLNNCISAVKKEHPNKEIILVGHSMGGYAVCNAINYHNIKKVIAIAPFDNVVDVTYENIYSYSKKNFLFFKTLYSILLKCRFKEYSSLKSFSSIKNTNCEVLVIQGTEDRTVIPNKFIESMMANNNPLVKFILMDGKGHEPQLSDNAITYNLFLKHNIDELKLKYNKHIPESELKTLNENINFKLKTELDEEVVGIITEFLK